MGARASPKRERGNQSPILIAVLDLPVIGTCGIGSFGFHPQERLKGVFGLARPSGTLPYSLSLRLSLNRPLGVQPILT